MDEEEREFSKRKMNLLLALERDSFEKGCQECIAKTSWENMEELDRWIADCLRKHDEVRHNIREFYNARMYS